MKTAFLLPVLVLTLFSRVSGQSPLDQVFDAYSGKEGYTTILLSPDLLVSLFSDEDDQSTSFSIKSVKVLIREDSVDGVNFYDAIIPKFNRDGYEEMMRTRSKDSKSVMMYRKNKDSITDFVYVSGGEDNVLFYLAGNLPLSSLHKISEVASQTTHSGKSVQRNE